MKKRIIAIIALAALIIGLLAGLIPAVSAAGNDRFTVGYSKKDVTPWVKSAYTGDLGVADKTYNDGKIITVTLTDTDQPQKMVSVPLAGYGDSDTRYSDKIQDDNGDGKIGLGDGVFVTATSVTDIYGTTLIYISLDGVAAFNYVVVDAKPKIVSAINKLGGSVSAERIYISGSHSHSAPDIDYIYSIKTSGSALEAYYNYYIEQVAAAAEEAYRTAAEAAMSKGQVESEVAGPYKLNSVRHYYRANGYSTTKVFVGSNEFNNFSDMAYRGQSLPAKPFNSGNWTTSAVAESDDTLYLLQFAPDGQNPILLVNWRAHPGFSGSKDKGILSADYINSMRYKLEQRGYRVSFIQGAAGNINPTSLYSGENSVNNMSGFVDLDGVAKSRVYGGLLADVALYCLNPANKCMTGELQAGRIRTRQINYQAEKEYTDGVLGLTLSAIALGKHVTFVSAPGELFDRYDSNGLQDYMSVVSYNNAPVDPRNPPLIASGDVINYKAYSIDNVEYNEWLTLNDETYGTPFVLGYTDNRAGYFPNSMAYVYNDNVTQTILLADGSQKEFQKHSYEASGAGVIQQGEGENIIKQYGAMLAVVTGEPLKKMCQHCGSVQIWEPLTKQNGALRTLGTGHYYLAESITGVSAQTKTIQGNVCLDLNGKTLKTDHSKNGMAFLPATDAVLSIMDSTGKGVVIGHASTNYTAGGVVSLLYGYKATLNLYGGTLKLAESPNISPTKGGVVAVNDSCTFNMYGGTVEGGTAQYGGAVYLYGNAGYSGTCLNISGGRITAGTATNAGNCVYINNNSDAKVNLSGNAQIDEIYCDFGSSGVVNTDQVNLNGDFTGTAKLQFSDKFTVKNGSSSIGSVLNDALLGHGTITYTDANGQIYYGIAVNNRIILIEKFKYEIFAVKDTTFTTVGYKDSIDGVLLEYDAGGVTADTVASYIVLKEDVAENMNITEDVYLDLNGKKITGNINIAEGSTLYCMDSYTDDYDVEDGEGYAVITGTVTGDLQGLPEGCPISGNERGEGYTPYYPGYLKIVENGETSFHRVDLGLESINFKPDDLGMSYTCNFSGDQVVARNVKQYGVAISIVEAPNADNLGTKSACSIFTKYQAGNRVNTGKSTRLINVMRQSYKDSLNEQMAELPIYGSAYLLTDEGYVFGTETVKTLREVVEAADASFSAETGIALRKSAIQMYLDFENVMSQWNIKNIQAEANKEENRTLKILVVGNSHGVDSTQMLGKIYKTENPDKDVLLGRLYHSGCRLDQHVDYLTNNAGQYIYYKTNADGDWDRIKPTALDAEQSNGDVLNGATMYEALVDEEWDAIIMLTGSNSSGLANTYNGDIQTIQNYVKQTLGYTPKFYWHMSWAHPVEDIEGDAFTTVNTSTGFMDNYNGDQMNMYTAIANAVKTKILPDTSFSGIMPTGTAIQNANSSYLRDADLYRDYTHASDLGRLIAGYTWYCTLEGVELNGIKMTTIPRSVLKSYITAGGTGDMVLTNKEARVVAESVRNALQNPFEVTQSVYTAQ